MAEFIEVTAGAKTYRIGRVGFNVRLDAAEQIRQKRRDEFSRAVNTFKDAGNEEQRMLVALALDKMVRGVSVTTVEVNDWLRSPEGEAFTLLCGMRKNLPAATPDDVMALLTDISAEDYVLVDDFLAKSLFGTK